METPINPFSGANLRPVVLTVLLAQFRSASTTSRRKSEFLKVSK